jgi:uncharacterized membrane protein YhfC
MRYTRYALLVFAAGALSGLVIVSAGLYPVGWIASGAMAAGIAALPAALVADWWAHRPWRKAPPKRRARSRRPSSSSSPRKRGSSGK